MSFTDHPGRLITFEGGEGSGKSTQLTRLAARLRGRGLAVVTTREPGGCPVAEEIRHWLLRGKPGAITVKTELLLMLAARVEHVHQVIEPALRQGAWVLCDRFLDSTLAYQGYGRGMELAALHHWHAWALGTLLPHRTLLLDLEPAVGLARAGGVVPTGQQRDRFEQEDLAFHHRVRAGFRALAEAAPGRFRLIDATAGLEQVEQQIGVAIHDLFADT
ncbi:MAG: dTMP kinase [Magnetococcus sp. DMHC-8]